jgi:hypothetical protein
VNVARSACGPGSPNDVVRERRPQRVRVRLTERWSHVTSESP